jgi:hypothetical protein
MKIQIVGKLQNHYEILKIKCNNNIYQNLNKKYVTFYHVIVFFF